MIQKFIKCASEYGTLYFRNSGVNSYAVTPYGVLVTNTEKLELHDELTVTIVCNGVAVNKFALRLTEKEEVRLHAKRKAIEVPETLGGFKFGKQVFRTIMVPTSEVPIYEVPFEVQQDEASSEVQVYEAPISEVLQDEVLIGLA